MASVEPVESVEPVGSRTTERAGRLALTGFAALHLLLFVPVALCFVLLVVSSVLVVVWVGVLLLLAVVPASRAVADVHRWTAGRSLGAPLPSPYLPTAGGPLRRLRIQALDPATWRDVAWMLWAMTLGVAASLLTLVSLLGVVTTGIWWYGVGPIMRGRAHVDRVLLTIGHTEALEQRVQQLTETRAGVVDLSAAELRRIERDLHDGPQARLASVSLSLGMADSLFEADPAQARRLLNEARTTSRAALGELRDVVRGIHPPILADRGLHGAVRALALDLAIPVDLRLAFDGRPPAPVESALYFAVAECLANTAKHAGAGRAWVHLHHDGSVMRAVVGDDGIGGADPRRGTGMAGVAARLAAFDGTMTVSSPPGGPTTTRLEVPCVLSSPKTTPCSGQD
ncbi:sensor domain-containing protein [Nocardioides sp. SYSU DS0651]|uniref:sensor histidine kinase n=1 Tax=Nocardioides sp. SYSU DS0651 TaxID=3415955 RepID=UPI003F4CA1CE